MAGANGTACVLSAADMGALDALDTTAGSVGRIMKGDNFCVDGDWRGVWDEGWAPTDTDDGPV